jgi:pyridoxamine 5'-phosphate oxidase-like protein
MQPQDVTRVLNDPLAQELMQSSIPARLAYVGPDGFPRAIPIGFHWNGVQFVLCTVPDAPKVSALKTNPKVALTVDTNAFPPHVLLVRGTAAIEIVDGVPPEYLAASRKSVGPDRWDAFEAQVRTMYKQMARIKITPLWAKLWTFRRDFQLQSRSCSAGRARTGYAASRCEEFPGLRQIARVSTFCEPFVHVMEHRALGRRSAAASQAQRGPQFPGPRPLSTGDRLALRPHRSPRRQ